MDNDENYFDAETMERLKQKGKLITDTSKIFEDLSKKIQVYKVLGFRGKRFLKKSVSSVYKDFRKGLFKINKKIPVFVEMPTLKSVGESGVVSKTYDGESEPSSYEVHDLERQKIEPVKSHESIDFTGET